MTWGDKSLQAPFSLKLSPDQRIDQITLAVRPTSGLERYGPSTEFNYAESQTPMARELKKRLLASTYTRHGRNQNRYSLRKFEPSPAWAGTFGR